MRGMCDEGERITKGVGVIRVSCYVPVTQLEQGRMRLRAQHVNKGGGHICKTRRWPHGASGHLGTRVAPDTSTIRRAVVSPQGLLAFAPWEHMPVEAVVWVPDLFPAFWPPSPFFSSSGSLTAVFAGRTMVT